MLRPNIDWGLCQGCTPCLARHVCRTRAIVQIDPGDVPYIELDRCSGCGACVLACCCQAITMQNENKVSKADNHTNEEIK